VKISTEQILKDIQAELVRAREKFPNTPHVMNALTEEVGELAKALLQRQYEPHKGVTNRDIYWEAVQVATMAIRVATEGDETLDKYKPERSHD